MVAWGFLGARQREGGKDLKYLERIAKPFHSSLGSKDNHLWTPFPNVNAYNSSWSYFWIPQNISLKVIKQKLYISKPGFAHKTKHAFPQSYRTLKENKGFFYLKIHPYNSIIIKEFLMSPLPPTLGVFLLCPQLHLFSITLNFNLSYNNSCGCCWFIKGYNFVLAHWLHFKNYTLQTLNTIWQSRWYFLN